MHASLAAFSRSVILVIVAAAACDRAPEMDAARRAAAWIGCYEVVSTAPPSQIPPMQKVVVGPGSATVSADPTAAETMQIYLDTLVGMRTPAETVFFFNAERLSGDRVRWGNPTGTWRVTRRDSLEIDITFLDTQLRLQLRRKRGDELEGVMFEHGLVVSDTIRQPTSARFVRAAPADCTSASRK